MKFNTLHRITLTTACAALAFTVAPLSAKAPSNPGDCSSINNTAFVSEEGGCKNLKTGLVFSMNTMEYGREASWDATSRFCSGLLEGGFSDWRLPSLEELQAVQKDDSQTALSLPVSLTLNVLPVWSSTVSKGKPALFNHGDGSVTWANKKEIHGANCVRGGAAAKR